MQPWHAQLDLRFEQRGTTTVLAHNQHVGPLRVQKALYPESHDVCHAVLVHPPAGVAAGDQLNINIALGKNAHALITTPGATQWYKGQQNQPARMHTHMQLAAGAKLDFLPQENILFDASHAQLHTTVDLDEGASAIGWELCVLGRRASGETWQNASLLQHTHITVGGRGLWLEHSQIDSDSTACKSSVALAEHSAMGTLWAVGSAFNGTAGTEFAQNYAETLPYTPSLKAGVSFVRSNDAGSGVLLLRVLGQNSEAVRACLVAAWLHLRPTVHSVAGVPLRIWAV